MEITDYDQVMACFAAVNAVKAPLAWQAAFEDLLRRHVQDHIDGLLFGVLLLQHCNSQISEA